MNRRQLLRNSLLALGAAAGVNLPIDALVFASGDDASRRLARPGWAPVFLTAPQNETLIALGEAIIPATDTPGATAALVNRFLDLVLSVLPLATQHEFVASLQWFNSAAQGRYKQNFADLSGEQQVNLLTLVAFPHTDVRWGQTEANFAGSGHFQRIKTWVAGAYYSSPVGLKELGWDGWPARGDFKGCEHQPWTHANDQ